MKQNDNKNNNNIMNNNKHVKWTRESNKEAISCWLLWSPDDRGFRKRMLAKWIDRNISVVISEQDK